MYDDEPDEIDGDHLDGKHVDMIVGRFGADLCDIARREHANHGRGAVSFDLREDPLRPKFGYIPQRGLSNEAIADLVREYNPHLEYVLCYFPPPGGMWAQVAKQHNDDGVAEGGGVPIYRRLPLVSAA